MKPKSSHLALLVAASVLACSASAQNLSSVTITDHTIIGGYRTTGKIVLDAAAPAGGINIDVSASDSDKVQVPATVFVPAGSKVKIFGVLTQTVLADTPVTVTASLTGVDKSDGMTLLTGGLTNMACDDPLSSGDVGQGQVWLSGDTAVDVAVELMSSDPAVASVPADVTVPAGDRYSDFFDITCGTVAVDSLVTIRSRLDVSIRTCTLTVRPIAMSLSFRIYKPNGVPRNGGLVIVTYSDGSTESVYTNPAGKAVFSHMVAGPASFIEDRPGSKGPVGPYAFVVLKSDPTAIVFTEP